MWERYWWGQYAPKYKKSAQKWSRSKQLKENVPACHMDSAQCYVAAWTEEKFGGEWIHEYVWLSPFSGHLKLSQHC